MKCKYRKKQIYLSPLFTFKEANIVVKLIDENSKLSSNQLSYKSKLDLDTLGAVATFILRKGSQRVKIFENQQSYRVDLISTAGTQSQLY